VNRLPLFTNDLDDVIVTDMVNNDPDLEELGTLGMALLRGVPDLDCVEVFENVPVPATEEGHNDPVTCKLRTDRGRQ